ncbi:MAG: hypothetical protein IKM54_07120 [Butyricicoccus sp.]|nr:hypothetical protein [Butyricicoccus sp.]
MYNRYLPEKPSPEPLPQAETHPSRQSGSGANGLLQLFGGRSVPDADMILALAVIWFLLADGEIVRTDVFIIVAVLLLLGL